MRSIDRLLLQGDINKAWFLDSAVEYDGAAVSKLSGLEHLEGLTVSAFSAGSVIEDISVTGGDRTEDWQNVVVSAQHDVAAPYTLGSGKFYYVLENKQRVAEREVKRNRFYLRNGLPLPLTLCAVGMRVDMGNVK